MDVPTAGRRATRTGRRTAVSLALALGLTAALIPGAAVHAQDDVFTMSCDTVDYQGESADLSFTWWVGGGDTPSDALFQDGLDCFNQAYAGSISVTPQYVPSQADYEQKVRADFAASGQLPVVVAPKRMSDFAFITLEQGALVDLMPYFQASQQWQDIAIPASTDLNTIDGALVAAPDTFQTPIGLFYNTALLADAGVDALPETWEEWTAMLEALDAAGIPAIAMHTADTGWSAMLIFEALMARDPDGVAFLEQKFPDDYDKPFIVDAANDIGAMFKYTPADAVGSVYEIAANNFLSGKAAIMPNGPWMIGQFRDPEQSSEGFGDIVAAGLFPGDVAVDDTGRQLGDYGIGAGYSQAETDAAAEFIKFMNSPEVVRQRVIRLGSMAPGLDLPEEDLASLDPLAASLIAQVQEKDAPILPNYQGQWNSVIQNETIEQGLAQLALGNMTGEQFAQALTDAALDANPE